MTDRNELGLQIEAGLREALAHRTGTLALASRHVEAMPAARVREIRRSLAKSTKCLLIHEENFREFVFGQLALIAEAVESAAAKENDGRPFQT